MKDKEICPKEKWEGRYGSPDYEPSIEPVAFLEERLDQLRPGRVLCLAAGAGRNAVYLAQQGYEVTAVDISAGGLALCQTLARERGVRVTTVEADLLEYDMGQEQYDLITNFFYYQPELFPGIKAALKPGGHFVMETFSVDQLRYGSGPRSSAHLVKPGELLTAFADLRIRFYEDTVIVTGLPAGQDRPSAAVIRLIAEKPDPAGTAGEST